MREPPLLDMDLDSGWTLGVNGVIHSYTFEPRPDPARILGSPLTVAGRLWLNGDAPTILDIEADATLAPSAHVDLYENTTLRFKGATTVEGGEWHVTDDAEVRFSGDTTMQGGTFGPFGGMPATGSVRFDGPTEWHGTVDFDVAATQYNTATVTGWSVISAGVFDMEGSGSTVWNIYAPFVVNAGRLEPGNNNFFEGEMNIGGGLLGQMTINLAEEPREWTMADTMNLTGDLSLFVTRVAGSPLTVWGDLTVNSGKAQITADTTIVNFGTVNLMAASTALRFNGETRIFSGATFNGVGTLHNGQAGTMMLNEGATLDQVGLVNGGRLDIDAGPGVASVDRFQNTATGTLSVSIGGYAAVSEHDLLIVSGGAAQLDGTLSVELINPSGDISLFEPQVGDEFTILTAAGGIVGTFDNPNPVSCGMEGLSYHWTVLYDSNEVRVRLDAITSGLPGDMNCDCRIDFFDIDAFLMAQFDPAAYELTYPNCTVTHADVNTDGRVDFFDIDPFVAVLFQ